MGGVRWRHVVDRGRISTRKLPWIGREIPTARRAKRNKPLRCRPLEGRRDQKSPFVVALSCVPRGERGSPVSPPAAGCCRGPVLPPGCRPEGIHPVDHRSFKTPGGCPAVGRMPTNRHAATGTCEIGQGRYTGIAFRRQGKTRVFPARRGRRPGMLHKRRAGTRGPFPRPGGRAITVSPLSKSKSGSAAVRRHLNKVLKTL